MSCGADLEANLLIASLTAGEDFELPEIDVTGPEFDVPGDATGPMYQPIPALTEAMLTSRTPGGSGMFDGLMLSFSNHLREEYEKGRITGADYTKAYIALTESALSGAVGYLLGKDQAYWQAQTAQINAITARVGLQMAKVQLAAVQLEALNQKANFALTKLKLSTESVTYCTAQFQLTSMLPQQLTNLIGQNALNTQQIAQSVEQIAMVKEQKEAQRAQTLDTRTDGATVTGLLGKQKALYEQQIVSYKRDAEVKAAKIFSDAWITQKTMDEGLIPPNGFTNASLDTILTALKLNNGF